MTRQALWVRLLLVPASVLLGLGLVSPCMTIQPSMGSGVDTWLRLLKPDELEPSTYSILGGILELMRSDSLWLGMLLFAFSVVFPSIKLATLWWGVSALGRGEPGGAALWLTHHAGKFSMLDVMVIAVFILAVKGLPGDTAVRIDWGLFAFAGSVVLSIVASILVGRMEAALAEPAREDASGASPTSAR
ncbi:MAG: paraquat-inducible protein A [Phycisphaeraceae bacterium]